MTLLAAWNTVYFHFWYHNEAVYSGTSDTGYLKQTKRQYIVWSLYLAAVIDAFYAYFICVTRSYSNRMNKKAKAEEPAMMMEAEKMDEMMMDEEKKEDAPEMME